MKTLTNLDKPYRDSIYATHELLEKTYSDIISNYTFDLSKTEISEAIIERLKAFYCAEMLTKDFLDKGVIPAAADYFVETILFFLKLFLVSKGGGLRVEAEKAIEKKKGAMRPDISIWKASELIAIIECKTQLGYNRSSWEADFLNREKRLKVAFPNAKAYLVVSTNDNWGGFGSNPRIGKNYFSLLDKGNRAHSYTNPSEILNPIEGLFKLLI